MTTKYENEHDHSESSAIRLTPDLDAWTIQKVLSWSAKYLDGRGSPTGRLDSELLLAKSLGCRRIDLYLSLDKPLTSGERDAYRALIRRRADGEPVAYILGDKEFFGRRFAVSPAVLIPRPETEHVVEVVQAVILRCALSTPSILDVGTGSGCIAISLALTFPAGMVQGWDISDEALSLAGDNAKALNATNVTFHCKDALNESHWPEDSQQIFDVIVSNPPYIRPDELASLSASVARYEPHVALFADGDGLGFYRILASHAPRLLRPGGALILEIGATQAEAVSALLTETGWKEITVFKDYAKLNRVVSAVIN